MLNKRGEKTQAIFQIMNLIFSIIAITFLIGINIGVVSGEWTGPTSFKTRGHTFIRDNKGLWLSKTAPGGSYYTDSTVKMLMDAQKASSGAPAIATTPGGSSDVSGWVGIKDAPMTPANPTGKGGFFSWQTGGFADAIISGAQWALTAYYVVGMIGNAAGWDEAKTEAASLAAAAGFGVGKAASVFFGEGGWWGTKMGTGLWGATGIGIAVAVAVYYTQYEEEKTETITFTCKPWDAPTGGDYCEECNKQGELPCSEYQCRSLGQSCQLVNPGTDEEKCVWVNRNDVEYPIIEPWVDALLDDYRYRPDNTISPPDRGVIIWNDGSTTGCAKAFTPLTFGITLDEPAKCKIDFLRKDTFDEMGYYFGGSSLLRYNHTQVMSLPGSSAFASENLTIQNDGDYELYVRCQDANGNHNTANFVFKYCVQKGPDTTPPLIVTTNLLNGMPIAHNTSSIDLEVYVNEPVPADGGCKWSRVDQSYDDMEESSMACSSRIFEMNAQMLYTCSTTLTGLKNEFENEFYFRCKDNAGNVNKESYEFSLIGTQPLVISDIGPNGTIKDSTELVKVTLEAETSAGYKEGEATCYHSETGDDDDYVMFLYENADNLGHKHSQDLWLPEGDYEYFIKCCDLGGNTDIKTVSFHVESDSESPIIVRAYHEETYLKLITNEEAECVYDTTNCNYLFGDGITIAVRDETSHFTDWNTKINFYIKCRDEYGNQPDPDKCSMIVKPVKIYEEE